MRRSFAVLLVALAASGCYKVTVVSGTPSPTVVNKPWQHSFVYGLVPPAELNVSQQCPRGIARVVTQQSFVNGLAGALTYSLYTPQSVTVTCAQ